MEKLPVLSAVTSSMISKIGYDVETKTLYVEFPSGSLYSYDDVEEVLYTELIEASSIGSLFIRKIKNGSFTYHKLKEPKRRK